MSSELTMRIADSLLALIWAYQLVIALAAGRLGGKSGFSWSRHERPVTYWGCVFILALMVLHFGGLAWVGQKLG